MNLNDFQTLASKRRLGASGLPLDRRWMINDSLQGGTDAAAQSGA
jgi:hypothetical protein